MLLSVNVDSILEGWLDVARSYSSLAKSQHKHPLLFEAFLLSLLVSLFAVKMNETQQRRSQSINFVRLRQKRHRDRGMCALRWIFLSDPIRMAEENNVERRKTKINNKQATSTQYIVVAIMQ